VPILWFLSWISQYFLVWLGILIFSISVKLSEMEGFSITHH